ncbi:MAG: ABC transporter substrate-binding protein [Oscillospiraceae bacterium]|jgi:ABC-type transport system substrate-binding protein|nr:ABC transporter substrate-binding protein [Oscillospiraceae bacterium]
MRKIFKNLLPILLILVCLWSLAACGDTPENVDPSNAPEVTKEGDTAAKPSNAPVLLPYSSGDSLHPFTAKLAINRQLATLIYDSLYRVDARYEASGSLAKADELDGKTLTVTVRTALFSDGKAITPGDVVASFAQAKKSGAYQERLRNVLSAEAQGKDSVVFTLEQPDPFVRSCLDFPVLPKENKSTGSVPPLGSGKYVIKAEKGSYTLTPNPRYREKIDYGAARIELVNITNPQTLAQGVGIGTISFATADLAGGVSESTGARQTQLPLNNLVYLALNNARRVWADAKLRQAVSLLLNREDLALGAFAGNARPADTPFNPAWFALEERTPAVQNRAAATKLIDETGQAGKTLKATQLKLLVNQDNPQKVECARRIMNALSVGGLRVTLQSLPLKDYQAAAKSGKFDLLVGECKLTANMDLSALFTAEGGAHHGIDSAARAAQSYGEFRRGAVKLEDFLSVFASDMPFVPLLYRSGHAYYDRALRADVPAAYAADVYAFVSDFRVY